MNTTDTAVKGPVALDVSLPGILTEVAESGHANKQIVWSVVGVVSIDTSFWRLTN